jgi:rubrerythrin
MTQRLYEAAKAVVDRWESGDLAEAVRALAEIVNDPELLATDDELIRAQAFCNEEINVDGFGYASRAEDESGVWVQGWVWVPNPEPEYGKGILNYYECPQCGTTWEDEWDCACNDTCPACGTREIEPHHSEELK